MNNTKKINPLAMNYYFSNDAPTLFSSTSRGLTLNGTTKIVGHLDVQGDIDLIGRIGLGTNEPQATLDNRGDMRVHGGTNFYNNITMGGTHNPATQQSWRLDVRGSSYFSGQLRCDNTVRAPNLLIEAGHFGVASDGDWVIDNAYADQNMSFHAWHSGTGFGIKHWFEDDGPNMNIPVYVAHWSFTGIHRSLTHNIVRNNEIDTFEKNINNLKGLIVISNGNYVDLDGNTDVNLNNSIPIAILCEKPNDKRVFGVIADMEQHADKPYRTIGTTAIQVVNKTYYNDYRALINSIGEGAIWVSNINGNFENGDYITSCSIPGYGRKQSDDLLHNYTVAKITCDCDFSLTKIEKMKLASETKTVNEKVLSRDDQGQITRNYEDLEYEFIKFDEKGNIIYENKTDDESNPIVGYKYDTRFIKADGTLLESEEEYTELKKNGENVYIACLVGCTYHCG